jgi:alanine racemase
VTRLTVDLDAIAANWRLLAGRHGGPTAGVVKADAYGLGAARVGARLYAEGARHFFVAYPEEGLALRPHVGGAMVGILNGLFPGMEGLYAAHGLAPVLGTPAEIAGWAAHGRHVGRALPALLHVDTGMNRLGLSGAELDALAADPARLDGIDVLFVMTHLANAELTHDPGNAAQSRRLRAACAALPPAPRSFANSSGLFLGETFRSDLARPGAALYGINPTPGAPNPMRPVMRLSARVLQMRHVGVGEAVGYNGTWVARRPTRVATVSAGYADGYHRILSDRAWAAFDGGRLPLIGRVSMDLTTFDATDAPGLAQGDEVELIGPAIPPDEVALWAGTNGYEVLTSLKPRHGRVYAAL